ncbi:MAG: ABC transporter ATP-binding protein [Dehalococcoidia bacterium]|jgi:putative ABC transport system ATP-binding protein
MSNDKGIVIVVDGLVKQFMTSEFTTVAAVNGVSFELPKEKMIAIKGPSGCGKTTLLNLIGALDKPTAGSIVVDGIKVSELDGVSEAEYRLRKVGFVFQYYYLIPNLTALENVMLPMDLRGMKRKLQEAGARQLLERVGIDESHQARRPTRLSGGEQQRVAIARALANGPAIILADEPTGNLDSKTSTRIIELLHGVTQEGRTVIVATHDADVAARADMVLEMKDGKLIGQSYGKS